MIKSDVKFINEIKEIFRVGAVFTTIKKTPLKGTENIFLKDVSVLFERTNEHAQRLAVTEKQIDALETSSNVTFNRTMTVLAILVSLGALVFTVLTRLMA